MLQAEQGLLAFYYVLNRPALPAEILLRRKRCSSSLHCPQKLDTTPNPLCFWQFCLQEQGSRHLGLLRIRAHTAQAMGGKYKPAFVQTAPSSRRPELNWMTHSPLRRHCASSALHVLSALHFSDTKLCCLNNIYPGQKGLLIGLMICVSMISEGNFLMLLSSFAFSYALYIHKHTYLHPNVLTLTSICFTSSGIFHIPSQNQSRFPIPKLLVLSV